MSDREIKIRIPQGMDPNMAVMLFQQLLAELHELEPLTDHNLKERVAEGMINDVPKIAAIRKKIVEAPDGMMWSIDVFEPQRVKLAGGDLRNVTGFTIDARPRLRECKNIEEVIKTISCLALITSTTARSVAAMNGYVLRIRPPVPVEDADPAEPGDGADA